MNMTQKLSSSASITVIASDLSDGIVKELRAQDFINQDRFTFSPKSGHDEVQSFIL